MGLLPGNFLGYVDFHLDIVDVHIFLLVFKTGGGFGSLLSLSGGDLFPNLKRPQEQGSWSGFVVKYLKNSAEQVQDPLLHQLIFALEQLHIIVLNISDQPLDIFKNVSDLLAFVKELIGQIDGLLVIEIVLLHGVIRVDHRDPPHVDEGVKLQ